MLNYIRNSIAYVQEFGMRAGIDVVLQRALRKEILLTRPKGVRFPLKCRRESSDFAVLRQIIGNREVDFDIVEPPASIIDAGANIGLSSIAFANRWPAARILAVEPDKENFALLLENTASYSNISCVHAAVWRRSGQVVITNPTAAAFSFQVGEPARFVADENTITAFTVPDLMDLLDVGQLDLLKIDIEGAEFELFDDSCKQWLPSVNTIAVEPHERYVKGVTERLHEACAGWSVASRGEYLIFDRRGQI